MTRGISEDILKGATSRLKLIEELLVSLEPYLVNLQQGRLEISSKSNEVDLVTQADIESERCLIECIRNHYPSDGIIAEEGSHRGEEAARVEGFQWILDPIDGTVNYANRLPFWAVSIGLLHGGERVAGLVTAPVMQERYSAVLGRGATMNSRQISVNTFDSLRNGIVATGFPYDRDLRAGPLSAVLANILKVSGGVRRLGSAALDMCYVADGRFIGYYEMGVKAWDLAAATLIAEEAGAKLTNLQGEVFDLWASPGSVIISNTYAHDALVSAVDGMKAAMIL